MSDTPRSPDAASLAQIAAADPSVSTWLSANAGSGKTRVLTNRVARLLIAGTPPQNILCLTYTKAAAGEMQNRLFATLGEWAMQPDAELALALAAIGVPGPVPPERLAQARRLFARAIETPGGLKIQTIHAFCAAILRQFPLEAGVSPGFRELDERQARLMRSEVFDRLAEGPQAPLLAEFARLCLPADLDTMLGELIARADALGAEGAGAVDEATLRGWYGLAPGEDAAGIRAALLDTPTLALTAAMADALAAGTEAQRRGGAALAGLPALPPEAAQAELQAQLLTRDGSLRSNLLKALQKLAPPLAEALPDLAGRLLAAQGNLLALDELPRARALYRFGAAYLDAYAQAKALRGVLDFDDLIRATLRLLTRSGAAAWVLFRLDGRIDHILVDEAQDTSPAQWRIIEALAQEFTAGAGARDSLRTVFAVGDRKQSIYSFQGADPAGFDRMRELFAQQMPGGGLRQRQLLHSFRSSALILDLVDRVFDGARPRGTGQATRHLAYHPDRPGRVDLWPLIEPEDAVAPPEWQDASPRRSARAGALVLAERLADEVARMLAEERLPDGEGGWRPLTAGDIVVLVRRRGFISDPLILALKQRGVPVAGADQIELTSELAVMDVMALLRVLVTPADSLSLAAVLRSPLLGLDEAALYDLAAGRAEGVSLWQALEASGRHPQAVALLDDLRQQADFLRPFELIARLLVRHDGRRQLRARLGDEVDEALDVLMAQAMAYEATGVPSLTGFLAWQEAEEVPVKRQAEAAGALLRVMTVHGAKGLEAPVVILPDTADYAGRLPQHLILRPDGAPLMRVARERRPPALEPLYQAEAQARAEEEDRLLYVALTRAQHWLIVCGAGKDKGAEAGKPCWHRQVAEALAGLSPAPLSAQGEGALRAERGSWPAAAPSRAAGMAAPSPAEPLPDWASQPAEPGPPLPALVSPSALAARLAPAAIAPGAAEEPADREAALRHGSRLHLLLEHLPAAPPAQWPALAAAVLAAEEEPPLAAETDALLAEAGALLGAPHLRWLFQAEALAEVDITAALPAPDGASRLLGRIDRLVHRPDGGLLLVDFKSDASPPGDPAAIPPGYLVQMGAYLAALGQVFPGQPLAAAILWTRSARLMEVPAPLAQAALARALAVGGEAAAP